MEIEKKIINMLRKNAREPIAHIGAKAGISPSKTMRVYRRLFEKGIIRKHTTIIDARKANLQHNILLLRPKDTACDAEQIACLNGVNSISLLSQSLFEVHTLHSTRLGFSRFAEKASELFEIEQRIEVIEALKEEEFMA